MQQNSQRCDEKPIKEFGFQGTLTVDFPSSIMFDITEICNLSCIHCPYGEFSKSSNFSAARLSIDLHNKIIDEIKLFGQKSCRYIRYTGLGETLTHSQLPNMLRYAKSSLSIPLTLTTNGTLLNNRRVQMLIDSEIHSVDVSIDAFYSQTYSKIRRGGKLGEVKKNVINFIRARDKAGADTKIFVSFVHQNLNSAEAQLFEDFWKQKGVDEVLIRRPHENAGASNQVSKPKQNLIKRYPCLYPWERLIIAPDGKACFCPIDWVQGSVIGDFSQQSIREIWTGVEMQALRDAHLKQNFKCHGFCGNCKDWATTTWPHHQHGKPYSALF